MNKEFFMKLFAKWAEEDVYIAQLTWEEADALAGWLSIFFSGLDQKLIDQQNYTLQLDRRQNADLQHDPNQ